MSDQQTLELERTDCPLCGSESSELVLETVDNLCGVAGVFYVVRCLDCRHLFMNPRPTVETLHLCYPDQYGPHQTKIERVSSGTESDVSNAAGPATPWYLKYLPLRYIPGLKQLYYWLTDDLGQPLPQESRVSCGNGKPKALELGCSTGAYLSRLVEAGWDVTGVEPSEAASEKARAVGFDVRTGVLDDVSLEDKSYDAVAAWMVIEHTIDPVGTLRDFLRILKPGGQLLFSVPNVGCWEPRIFRSAWYVWEAPRHLSHFTPRRLRQALNDLGYTEIQVVHQRNVLNIIGSFGILLKRWKVTAMIGERILRYPDSPRLAIQLLLTPVALALSFLRQGGRLTVVARRPDEPRGVLEGTTL